MKKIIILISGDPNSINSEIIFKCWKKISKNLRKKIFVISNYQLLKDQFKRLNYKVNLSKVSNPFIVTNNNGLKVLDIKIDYIDPFKVSKKSASKFVRDSLNLAHKLGLNKNVAGIINCPIAKNLLGNGKIGVTEYLAKKCSINDKSEVMIIKNEKLMVSPITTHLDIKSVSKMINKNLITKKVKVINKWYKKIYKKRPKLAMLGLNPHNAELRHQSEEKKHIIPAIKSLKKSEINVDGPLVSDTIFIKDYKNYNLIVGMYHDQVLSPFKAMYKFDAINLTLGLKYIRTSPDHGIAKDKIMKKKSNPLSLLKCVNFIHKISK